MGNLPQDSALQNSLIVFLRSSARRRRKWTHATARRRKKIASPTAMPAMSPVLSPPEDFWLDNDVGPSVAGGHELDEDEIEIDEVVDVDAN